MIITHVETLADITATMHILDWIPADPTKATTVPALTPGTATTQQCMLKFSQTSLRGIALFPENNSSREATKLWWNH